MRRLAAFAILLFLAACRRDASAPVHVITSTEVAGTGLPQLLTAEFERTSGVEVDLQVVEAETLRTREPSRDAVVVITNDAAALRRLASRERLQAKFASDDFVVLGPPSDPAHVGLSKSAPEAFQRIARGKRAFCSAADVPRYRAREAEIWKAAGVDPSANRRYRLCHGNIGDLLRDVESRRGYTLLDRAGLASLPKRTHLDVLLEGTPMLRNDYWIVLVSGERPARNAEWMVQWAMSYHARELIEQHRVEGEKRFFTP